MTCCQSEKHQNPVPRPIQTTVTPHWWEQLAKLGKIAADVLRSPASNFSSTLSSLHWLFHLLLRADSYLFSVLIKRVRQMLFARMSLFVLSPGSLDCVLLQHPSSPNSDMHSLSFPSPP